MRARRITIGAVLVLSSAVGAQVERQWDAFVLAADRFERSAHARALVFTASAPFPPIEADSSAIRGAAVVAAALHALGRWAESQGFDTQESKDTIWATSRARRGALEVVSRTAVVAVRVVATEVRVGFTVGRAGEVHGLSSRNGVLDRRSAEELDDVDLLARFAGAGVFVVDVTEVEGSGVFVSLAVEPRSP